MSLAEELEGKNLPGKRRPGNWEIIEKLTKPSNDYGGSTSVGYKVRHDDGYTAFMKASDLDLMTEGTDMLARVTAVANHHTFERSVLEYCHGNNMDRIVTAIDYGEVVVNSDQGREPLFWIVFELAKCDAKVQINLEKKFNFVWCLHAMHNLSTAVQQLHMAEVSHNDIKPSNFFIFEQYSQKLGDLGSSTAIKYPRIHDETWLGDPRFAAPEILYDPSVADLSLPNWFDRRRAADLYLLGSMGFFFVTGTMMTPVVESHLSEIHRATTEKKGGWGGEFRDVLPYWREGYSRALLDLEGELPKDNEGNLTAGARDYIAAITQLCEPSPELRGHPHERIGHRNPYGTEKYISLFDRLRLESLIRH